MKNMIVKRSWHKRSRSGCFIKYFEGWFLFGIIPMYIKSTDWKL